MREIARVGALIEVRFAKEEDLPALVELERMCFKEEVFHKRQLEYLLLKARSLALVADCEGNVIGSILVLLRGGIASARIYSLNVHPAYRRRGIGGKLMDAAEKSLVERGFKKITLEVGINNTAAQSLYMLKGFSVDRVLGKYYKNCDDALHLVKKL